MYRGAFLISLLVVTLGLLAESAAADMRGNPVVPDGQLGEFRHGTYPSLGVGDGDWTHVGVDLTAPCGTRVYAFADGKVVDVISSQQDEHFASLGYMVLIEHPPSLLGRTFYTVYLHFQEPPPVKTNESVQGGVTNIGRVGNRGTAFGCHTHFEARYFQGRFLPEWGNIYGTGDQRQSQAFKDHWEDPEALFRQHPAGLTAAPATAAATPAPSATAPQSGTANTALPSNMVPSATQTPADIGNNPVVPGATLGPFRHLTLVTKDPVTNDLALAASPAQATHIHPGVDLVAPCGTPIYPLAPGHVKQVITEAVADHEWLGNAVLIEHPATVYGEVFYTLYLHMASVPAVRPPNPVVAGQPIGAVGATGRTKGQCHTHFEVRFFPDLYYQPWCKPKCNIYGPAAERDSEAVKRSWEDPVVLLSRPAQQLATAPAGQVNSALVEDLAYLVYNCEAQGQTACAADIWAFTDVTGDSRLTIAEMTRLLRIMAELLVIEEAKKRAGVTSVGGEASFPVNEDDRAGAIVLAGLAGPLTAYMLIQNFDYNGDGAIERAELFVDMSEAEFIQLVTNEAVQLPRRAGEFVDRALRAQRQFGLGN